jgi:protoheme ferro-lyase
MSNLKDKCIIKDGLAYVAKVYWYDGGTTNAGRHATLKAAQKALERFPNDVFEGYANPSSEKAIEHMEDVKRERATFIPKFRRKVLPDYERLYDRRVR